MTKKIVVKFGGSNLKTHDDYRRLAHIVKQYNRPLVIVVSAFYGLTNQILEVTEKSRKSKAVIEKFIYNLGDLHRKLVIENINNAFLAQKCLSVLNQRIDEVRNLLIEINRIGEIPESLHDQILSYGERFSSTLVHYVLADNGISSQEILPEEFGLITDGKFGYSTVDFTHSIENVKSQLSEDKVFVVPGFYGISPEGKVTIFGRGGSDYTASCIAHCLEADSVDLWKDVDGFLSADPRIVDYPSKIEKLNYNKSAELACFGARILHPETITPLKSKKIPLNIFNISNFDKEIKPSTIINCHSNYHTGIIKSITYSDDFGILRLKGAGVGAKPGILAEITHRLEAEKINIKSVITSQISINILLAKSDLENMAEKLRQNPLKTENEIAIEEDISVIAVVGHGLMDQAGVMATIIGAVATKNINIKTIVMGASEVSAYLIVGKSDRNAAIKVIHNTLFKSNQKLNNQIITN